jgi:excisionase family DNA binding protein
MPKDSEAHKSATGLAESPAKSPEGDAVEWFDTPQARRLLERLVGYPIGKRAFYNWVHSGKIRHLRLGGKHLVSRATIEEVYQKILRGENFLL